MWVEAKTALVVRYEEDSRIITKKTEFGPLQLEINFVTQSINQLLSSAPISSCHPITIRPQV